MRLDAGWTFAISDAGAAAAAAVDAATLDFLPAIVPGTAAQALIAAGRWSWDQPPSLDDRDVWYRTAIEGHGPHRLVFEGLATLAEVYLDERLILRGDNMFVAHEVDVLLAGAHRLSICFRALAPGSVDRKGRARWRPRMIQPSDLRFVRTSALGHMPGFAPPAPPIGPWRPVRLLSFAQPTLLSTHVHPQLDGDDGLLHIELRFDRAPATAPQASCEGATVDLELSGEGVFNGDLRIKRVEKWFPHTHGDPRLYRVTAAIGDEIIAIARTGFRTIAVARDDDGLGFALAVNGVKTFCRGAVWTPLDAIGLQNAPDALARTIALAKDAGVNMLRVGGTCVYETDAFHQACDEAGILVWQDFMFSNFDYPIKDENFAASVESEARAFLARTCASPSLAVLCGGNEVYQQGAMMGVAESFWRSPLFEELLPRVCAQARPDVPYVANSPSGGAQPFHADAGVSHYYGVGAYRRPLEDARRANVRFASECLGFANVPETRTLIADFGAAPLSSPLWAPRIPRDQGAMQDFEQVRDHYIALLYSLDPDRLKRDDPERYLDFSRATVAEVVETTIAEWRRPDSSCAGALLWFWKDLWPSSGFGVLDWRGRPKSPYWAMRRAFRAVQIVLSDEGVNGLRIHVLNERPVAFTGRIELRCYKDGATVVMNASREIALGPRATFSVADGDLWGAFFDTGYAYRFGPPSHEATVATLTDAAGVIIAEAWHFPLGRAAALSAPKLSVDVLHDDEGYGLKLETNAVAQSIRIEDRESIPRDNWLHLAPGASRIVRFIGDAKPQGIVAALGGEALSYRAE